jgi:hypothetical protein
MCARPAAASKGIHANITPSGAIMDNIYILRYFLILLSNIKFVDLSSLSRYSRLISWKGKNPPTVYLPNLPLSELLSRQMSHHLNFPSGVALFFSVEANLY